MKKILIFIALLFLASELNIQANQEHAELRGTEIEVKRVKDDDGNTHMVVTGTGTNAFTLNFGDNHAARYNAEEIYVENDLFIIKGYITNRDLQTYNPFMIALTHEGDIMYDIIFDSGYIESILNVYFFEDYQIIHLRREKLDEDKSAFDYLDDRFIKMQNNQIIETRVVTHQINHVDFEDDTLILKHYKNTNPIALILPDFTMIEEGTLAGVLDTMTYYDEVTLYFTGEILINHEPFTAPLRINTIGDYQILYLDETYNFTLLPSVEGVSHKMITNNSVTIHYENHQAKLNGYLYHSGTEINEPGHYTLSFEQGAFKHTIDFTITSNIQGIYHNQTYDHPKRITFNGQGYLNNQVFESGNIIEMDGTYILRIYGVNNYEEAHHFQIVTETEDTTLNHLKVVELSLLAGAIFVGGYLVYSLIKKK